MPSKILSYIAELLLLTGNSSLLLILYISESLLKNKVN